MDVHLSQEDSVTVTYFRGIDRTKTAALSEELGCKYNKIIIHHYQYLSKYQSTQWCMGI